MPRQSKTGKGVELGKRIGRNIKVARTQLGITQGQLAEALGIENVTVSRIETGAQLPSLDRLDDISSYLKVSLQTLLGDMGENGKVGKLIADVVEDLPAREQQFILTFAMHYAQHWRAGKKR